VRRPVLFTTTVLVIACSGIGEAPQVAFAQQLVVVNKSSNSLSVIDPVTRQEVAEIPTGFAPHEVGISPDGLLAYVTDYGTGPEPGSTITVIDLGQAEPIAKIELGAHTRPHGIVVATDGTIWVTTEGSRHVLHIDPLSQRIIQEIAGDNTSSCHIGEACSCVHREHRERQRDGSGCDRRNRGDPHYHRCGSGGHRRLTRRRAGIRDQPPGRDPLRDRCGDQPRASNADGG
jgi:YVTN family beta-propeller protein